MTTTPTGIPITLCATCQCVHPATRPHCPVCGSASPFGHAECRDVMKETTND